MGFQSFSHRAALIVSAVPLLFREEGAADSSLTFVAKSVHTHRQKKRIKYFTFKPLMAIYKPYNSLHGSIKESFSLFAFSPGMSSKFPQAIREKRGCVMYFISIGRTCLIQMLHILTLEGPVEIVWESMGGSSQDKNNWLLSNSCGRRNN